MKSLKNFLDQEGKLRQFPVKRTMKEQALAYLAGKFQPGQVYTEREVNDLLCQWHTFGDPATLRRELYDARFLDRDAYGRSYQLAQRTSAGEPAGEEETDKKGTA